MKEKIKIHQLMFILIIVAIAIYFWPKEEWQGFYYPDGCLVCEDDYIISSSLKDRESCVNWAETLKQQRDNPNDTYECGKNCKLRNSGFYICEETF